jgi:peptidoglycan/LPS O-acetylase OafA/YrhL
VKEITRPIAQLFDNRPDIQVLRGLAVLAVVFYHLGLPIDGGFLGVDSFFVISGYVITGSLLRSKGTNKSRILLFYKKRVRRIFPLSVYITLITLLASFLFLPSIYLKRYFLDAIASIFMVSNIKFAKDGVDYLQQTLQSSPFLHFWSLGVEEQFYLIWPLLLLSLFRWKALYYIALPTLFVASAISTHFYPTASFFSPTSRSWEFLAGAFVATLSPRKLHRITKYITVLVSSFLVLISLIIAKPSSNMLQFFILLVVIGTGVLIYVGFSSNLFKPLEAIGNISYSLYLIHWPIIAIVLFHFEGIDKFLATAIFLCSLILAQFVTSNFENPIRFKLDYLRSSKFWLTAFVPILVLCVLAWSQGFSINQRDRPFEINAASPIIYNDGCHTTEAEPKMKGCDFGDLESNKLIMLVGDSHAAQWFPGFESASVKNKFKLRVATKSACPALLLKSDAGVRNSDCTIWEKNVLEYINTSKPKIVVISNLTEYSSDASIQSNLSATLYIESLVRFISQIDPNIKVAVIGDTPYPGKDSVACLSLSWKDSSKCDLENNKAAKTEMTRLVSNFRTTYFDSRPLFCQAKTCPAIIDRKNVYRDGSHLSLFTVDLQENLAIQILDLLD